MKKSICMLVAYLALSVTVYADITVFDSNTTISDGDSYDQVLIKGNGTVVTMTGGTVFQVRTMDSATFNMTGGTAVISGGLRSYDTSTLNLSSGSIGSATIALGESTINCLGNINLSELRTCNSSRLNISDDAYIAHTLECKHNSTVEITGGTIGYAVSVESESENVHISISGGIITAIKSNSGAAISNEIGIVGYNLSKVPISSESIGEVTGNWNDNTPFSIPFIGEYPYPLVVLYDGILPPDPLPPLQDQITTLHQMIEEIELTPGPQGPQGSIGPQGPAGPQGEQGPAGITPAEITQMQAQIIALQQANTLLQQQNALLLQKVEENRYLLEQLPQLKKKLEELMTVVEEEIP